MKFDVSTTKEFANPSTGPVSAVLIQIVDLGTQKVSWQGEDKFQQKVKFVFEIDELMGDGRPFVVNRDFTVSLHEKSSLRLFLESWRGQKYSDDDLAKFDPKTLLGKPCTLTLMQSKDGKYVNIDSAAKLMKGVTPLVPVNPVLYYDMSHHDSQVFSKLWPWVQKKIEQSPEYMQIQSGGSFADLQSDDLTECF